MTKTPGSFRPVSWGSPCLLPGRAPDLEREPTQPYFLAPSFSNMDSARLRKAAVRPRDHSAIAQESNTAPWVCSPWDPQLSAQCLESPSDEQDPKEGTSIPHHTIAASVEALVTSSCPMPGGSSQGLWVSVVLTATPWGGFHYFLWFPNADTETQRCSLQWLMAPQGSKSRKAVMACCSLPILNITSHLPFTSRLQELGMANTCHSGRAHGLRSITLLAHSASLYPEMLQGPGPAVAAASVRWPNARLSPSCTTPTYRDQPPGALAPGSQTCEKSGRESWTSSS